MLNFNITFQKILIIASLSMVLSLIIVSSTSITYIKVVESQSRNCGVPQTGMQPASDILKQGNVGEVKSQEETGGGSGPDTSTQGAQLPPVIFNASGIIASVGKDRLVVKGDGASFADNVSRDLSVIFTPQTLTFNSQAGIKLEGLSGLNYLKAGDKVLIGGEENVRGKVEFKARTINVLQ